MRPRPSRAVRRPPHCAAALLLVFVLFPPGCGSDSNGVTDPNGDDPTPAIALTISPTSATVEAGNSHTISATVTRSGGFTGTVTVEVLDRPDGVGAAVTGGGAGTTVGFEIELAVAASTAPGSHELTIRASGTGVDAVTRSFALTVTEPDGGGDPAEVTLDFSGCLASDQPLWVGYRDGSDPWAQVSGPGPLWTFEISADEVAYAWVSGEEPVLTQVVHLTREELLAVQPFPMCTPERGEATMTGTVAGLGTTEMAMVSMGQGSGFATGAAPQLQVAGLAEGVVDLIARRVDVAIGMLPNRLLVRRDVEVVDGGDLGTLDFEGSEAFDPALATVSIGGGTGGTPALLMGYSSGPQCLGSNAALGLVQGEASAQLPGVPEVWQRDGDVHQYTASETGGSTTLVATEFHRTLADRTVELPPAIDPSVTELAGPGRRVSAETSIPPVFRGAGVGNLSVTLTSDERTFSTAMSLARIPGNTGTVATEDLSGAPGWSPEWTVPAGGSSQWVVTLSATHSPSGDPRNFCVDGTWVRVASEMEG